MTRAFDPIGQWAAERRSVGSQMVDRGRNQVVGLVVESKDPRLHVVPEPHIPGHFVSID